MPLLFESISHGEVPFGFFNIETDMILLNNYFFFASDVSDHIAELAKIDSDKPGETSWKSYILKPEQIGNLMGAISGIDLRGFIGKVYSRFPFPHEPERFKQSPEGFKNRGIIEDIVVRYANPSDIKVIIDRKAWTIMIGEYLFSRYGFHELIRYLWLGGYPRWKDGIRPDYIIKMKDKVERSNNPLFDGIKGMLGES